MRIAFLLLFALSVPALAADEVVPVDDARAHFDRAQRAYNLGEFAVALEEYKTAYKLNPLPAFLFNIGQCHYALAQYERSVFFYEGFLREAPPTHPHRSRVEGFIAEARRRQEAIAAEPVAKVDEPHAPEPPAPEPPAPEPPAPAPIVAPAAPPETVAPDIQPVAPDDGFTDSAWFWPSVAGAAAVAIATTAVIVVVATTPRGSLDPIDARGSP